MKKVEQFAGLVSVSIFVFFLAQQTYLGLTLPPTEVDSLAYHIPIARHIQKHGFWSVPELPMGLGYYPAVGESLLALMLLAGDWVINLFNVAGIASVFAVSIILAKAYGLSKESSIVFASAASLLPPAIRVVNNQTVDVWFQLFALSAVYFLKTSSSGTKSLFLAGLSLGLLAGTKFSGPLFAAVIILFFLDRIKLFRPKSLVSGLIPFLVIGGFWYVRNLSQTGNPFYPANIEFLNLELTGDPTNLLADWIPIKTLLFFPGGLGLFTQAVISEYNVWLVFLAFFLSELIKRRNKLVGDYEVLRLAILGLVLFSIFFITPSWPRNIISDLRYTLPGMSLLLLGFFVYFARELPGLAGFATIFSLAVNLPLINHHPKVNFLMTIPILLFWLGKPKKFRSS